MSTESNLETKDETKGEKFVRIATSRMNKALKAISALENLSNRNTYAYSQAQVDAMFSQLEVTIAETKEAFVPKKTVEKSFSFGDIPLASDETDSDTESDDADDDADESE